MLMNYEKKIKKSMREKLDDDKKKHLKIEDSKRKKERHDNLNVHE